MMKNKNKLYIGIVGVCFAVLVLLVWFTPDAEHSTAERRKLKQMPDLTWETVLNGRFMSEFESYCLDQFPFRDVFRSLKAMTSLKADNNDVYVVDGVINSMDYPLKEESLDYAADRFYNVYNMYLKDAGSRIYLSVIPDKNYFYGQESGYLTVDYDALVSKVAEDNSYMTYLDIFPYLTGEDYYKTDTHWRQDKIVDVAEVLLEGMGHSVEAEYELVECPEDFYGVYYGQAALPLAADKITYVENSVIRDFKVYDYQNSKDIPVYDSDKMVGDDPYEIFVGGPISLVTIENPQNPEGGHLIVFRDSFGSSIAPLLAQGYAKTTLIDIRYIQPAVLKNFVDFENADVLFMYSTMVLNNSETLK